eukprot:TRINITY_DN11537_c0_g1_i2.p1 TRINITY_DN11537_c0_g1~~TRINITY_DN11537_c0_g1_i2.p1  ORF type:complete len:194 (+),score=9.86 TRINITY_DN11537_c0_g1_i2:308-889(+)
MPDEYEAMLRSFACECIIDAAAYLRVPINTAATAQAILQRFYYRKSFLKMDLKDVVMASMCLACKLEETPRKIRDVVSVFYQVFKIKDNNPRPVPVLDLNSKTYMTMRTNLVETERHILKELDDQGIQRPCAKGLELRQRLFTYYFMCPLPSPRRCCVLRIHGCKGTRVSNACLLYTSPSPRDGLLSRMPSSA